MDKITRAASVMARPMMIVIAVALLGTLADAQDTSTQHFPEKQTRSISFKQTQESAAFPQPESNAKEGQSAAQVEKITTVKGACTGKVYRTGIYASVDKNNLDNTYLNYDLTLKLDDCPAEGYKAEALFLTGFGTAFTAPSSLPKEVVGGTGYFKNVDDGYWELTDAKNGVTTVTWEPEEW